LPSPTLVCIRDEVERVAGPSSAADTTDKGRSDSNGNRSRVQVGEEEQEQQHTTAKELATSSDDDASLPPHDVDRKADYEEQQQEIHEEGDGDHDEGQSDSDSGSEGDGEYFCEILWSILKRTFFINSLFLFLDSSPQGDTSSAQSEPSVSPTLVCIRDEVEHVAGPSSAANATDKGRSKKRARYDDTEEDSTDPNDKRSRIHVVEGQHFTTADVSLKSRPPHSLIGSEATLSHRPDDHLHAAEAAEEIHDGDLAINLQDVAAIAAMPEEQQQPIVEEVESDDAIVPVTVVGAGTRRYS